MIVEIVTDRESLQLQDAGLVLPIGPDGQLEWEEGFFDRASFESTSSVARVVGLTGQVGRAVVVPSWTGGVERFVLAGVGKGDRRTLADVRRTAAQVAKVVSEAGGRVVAWPLVAVPGATRVQVAQAIVEGTGLASYRFHRYRSNDSGTTLERLVVLGRDSELETGLRRGQIAVQAVSMARDLANEPANVLDPEHLSGVAWEIAQNVGLECAIHDRALLEELGAGAILAVGRGSQSEPRLTHLSYRPHGAVQQRIALVGKAVTFDSGGLSLKPAEGMERMKGDMAGGAVVLAVMHVLPELQLPVEVHGVVAAAENLPDGRAFRPGDILRTMSGKTVEVISTDAEGRLLLADALTYAVRQGVDLLLDVATLTGACAVALGRGGSGVFASETRVGELLLRAANEVGERMWMLPLWDEYRELLRSEHADLKNTAGRWGGAITAALFLREFTSGKSWIHLDIAGPAWSEQTDPFGPAGATGHGVRTVLRFLELWSEQSEDR